VPTERSAPRRMAILAGSLFLGLALGVLVVVLMPLIDRIRRADKQ
jgi:uncharacterized protein involved in exopolysaccharide biosynthesis